jgi:predicted CoA-substrate-specific enzyme activase
VTAYIAGLDLGSTSAECVIVDEDHQVVSTAVVQTGTVSKDAMQRALEQALAAAGLTRDELRAVAATGYGRRLIEGGADYVFTEISSHAKGVAALIPGVRLVIDIGGQDTKAIRVDEDGYVERFAMNDRCASGTGRFYEGLAQALETDIGSLGTLADQGRKDLQVSSLCATFAVTEVIALLAKGEAPADIAASVHHAAAARALGLVGQVGKATPVALTGGVAKNSAAVRSLAEALGEELLTPDDPQITGALGAALLAADRIAGEEVDSDLSGRDANPAAWMLTRRPVG